ncbi:LysR family transcriptional regulator [Pectobacterium polonicum]|uniref:LysR family transcriptional regulator n=1 Tax=Pectobacterium polonicum TaxID=2485124 RepID=UPI0010FA5CE4|nr:LysR family transcriptional regulator [Pectobacterium polonicum]TKY82230.1 LysR family transcriptional regulator [Pectobacterium polonicum]GKW25334.1 transcriptional regulator [Pectobacterium carotovorum subsp. carotovorum]
MELRYLRYFVAVAQAKHFTRAAENLGMSQPPLSQQIKKFEQEIGTPLFKRLTRGVEMTEAGQALYEDAYRILQLTDSAIARTRSIARGETGSLKVGFSPSAMFHPTVLSLLHRYCQQHPHVQPLPKEENPATLIASLQERHIDIAFLRLPCDLSDEINGEILAEEPMKLVLPAGHTLSHKAQVSLSELRQEPLIIFPREVCPGLHDMIIRTCYLSGYGPKPSPFAPQLTATIGMVAAGFGITLVPESLACIKADNVTYHDIGMPKIHTQIAAIWRKHERSAAIVNLIYLIRQHLSSQHRD